MSKRLVRLWTEVAAYAATKQSGWVRRLINPSASVPLHIAVECSTGVRSLMLDISPAVFGTLHDMPQPAGLKVALTAELEGVASPNRTLALSLEDQSFGDLFLVFCNDLIDRIAYCHKTYDAVVVLKERVRQWQSFLSDAQQGLSESELVGLYGELCVLRDLLIPIGGAGTVSTWTGTAKAPQDFVVPGLCAIEVKCTTSQVMTRVRIHGELQLDRTGFTHLFLLCVRLERPDSGGESVVTVIESLRNQLSPTEEIAGLFEQKLAQAKWFDRNADRYRSVVFHVAQERCFRVDASFPAITSAALPLGIDTVDYTLDLKACESSELKKDDVADLLSKLNLTVSTLA